MARQGLERNRKFIRLCRFLEPYAQCCAPDVLARGFLETLWQNGYDRADDYIGDEVDVESAAHWKGETSALAHALLLAAGEDGPGFIEEVPDRPGRYRIHDFWTHCPKFVRDKADRESERVATGESVSDKRRKAAQIRWERERATRSSANSHANAQPFTHANSSEHEQSSIDDANGHANGMQISALGGEGKGREGRGGDQRSTFGTTAAPARPASGNGQGELHLEPDQAPKTARKKPTRYTYAFIEPAITALREQCSERLAWPDGDLPAKTVGMLGTVVARHPDTGHWEILGEFLHAGGEAYRKVIPLGRLIACFEDLMALALDWERKGRPNPMGRGKQSGQADDARDYQPPKE